MHRCIRKMHFAGVAELHCATSATSRSASGTLTAWDNEPTFGRAWRRIRGLRSPMRDDLAQCGRGRMVRCEDNDLRGRGTMRIHTLELIYLLPGRERSLSTAHRGQGPSSACWPATRPGVRMSSAAFSGAQKRQRAGAVQDLAGQTAGHNFRDVLRCSGS